MELAPAPGTVPQEPLYRVGVAGDTFNTAVTLARLGGNVRYVTKLGDDELSDRIVSLMASEGMGSGLVSRVPDRQPGLYMITNTPDGERTFRYWRGESPARELFADADAAAAIERGLADCGLIYLSGISLAILGTEGRDNLFAMLERFRDRGIGIAFDSNYRPRLWRSVEEAREVTGRALALSHMALLTFEDEQALWGLESASESLDLHGNHGCELVIKQGAKPVMIDTGQQVIEVPVPPVGDIVDTTGAGDAFNGGYLAARLQGRSPAAAVAEANRAAAAVIRRRGGIVDRDYFQSAMASSGLSA